MVRLTTATRHRTLRYRACKGTCWVGAMVEPRDIVGAAHLDQCACTRSSKDGCFQAHLLVVAGVPLPFPLTIGFRTLPDSLGCFPLDHAPSHAWSVSQGGTAAGLRRFPGVGKALDHPNPMSALHPACAPEAVPQYVSRRTSYLQV